MIKVSKRELTPANSACALSKYYDIMYSTKGKETSKRDERAKTMSFFKETYQVFTRKQAGILYGATKRGELAMSNKQTHRMYSIVGQQRFTDEDTWQWYWRMQYAVQLFFADELETAQQCIDGCDMQVVYDKIEELRERKAAEYAAAHADDEDDWDWDE